MFKFLGSCCIILTPDLLSWIVCQKKPVCSVTEFGKCGISSLWYCINWKATVLLCIQGLFGNPLVSCTESQTPWALGPSQKLKCSGQLQNSQSQAEGVRKPSPVLKGVFQLSLDCLLRLSPTQIFQKRLAQQNNGVILASLAGWANKHWEHGLHWTLLSGFLKEREVEGALHSAPVCGGDRAAWNGGGGHLPRLWGCNRYPGFESCLWCQ